MAVKAQGRPSLRDDQVDLTRARIMEALVILLQQRNPATLPMRTIAAEAGISDRTLYRHYPTKRELYEGLFSWTNEQVLREVPTDFATPQEWIASIPTAFAALDRIKAANTILNTLPEAAPGIAASDDRRRRDVARALAPLLSGFTGEEARERAAIAHLLGSSRALYFLQNVYGMTTAAAAEACQRSIEKLLGTTRTKKGRP